ncbi:amidohydrolase [Microbacterium sp. 1.5R]|uniref:amidohydrolase family protein n=1 Tax=Microbacterium sp. 1.5R TaxID=1916917 RepID=UPI001C92FA29|nr:amidohydrolase family protein [Microbacterium sp. 1.5R]
MTVESAARIRDARLPDGYDLRIVDAHHHFWDLDGDGRWPWIQDEYNEDFFLGDYHAMRRTFLPPQYLAETAGWNVVGTVHCEAERSRDEQVAEDDFLQSLSDATDGRFPLAAVAHVGFLQPDRDEVLAAHAARSIVRGIRSKPVIAPRAGERATGPGTLQDPQWVEGIAALAAHGFSWDLRVPYHHLAEAADVLADFPDLPVVINHCGLPLDRSDLGLQIWRQGMERLAALPRTVVKVSELGLYRNRWDRPSNEAVVRDTLAIFGADRALFASNMPVATLTAPSFDEVMDTILAGAAQLDSAGLDALFHGTAARVYRLDLP